jgi:Tfp pilus assembly protein PilV
MKRPAERDPQRGARGKLRVRPLRRPPAPTEPRRGRKMASPTGASGAFTLLEVMIAAGILFMCLFAILALLSTSLRNARALQRTTVDAGMLAADLSLTNRLIEGTESGDFSQFGDHVYPDYRWTRQIQEVASNGLFQVDFTISPRSGRDEAVSHMSILLFRPDSPPGSMSGGMR